MIGYEYSCVIEIESLTDVSFFNAFAENACVYKRERLHRLWMIFANEFESNEVIAICFQAKSEYLPWITVDKHKSIEQSAV